jgi:hypothetical protein
LHKYYKVCSGRDLLRAALKSVITLLLSQVTVGLWYREGVTPAQDPDCHGDLARSFGRIF